MVTEDCKLFSWNYLLDFESSSEAGPGFGFRLDVGENCLFLCFFCENKQYFHVSTTLFFPNFLHLVSPPVLVSLYVHLFQKLFNCIFPFFSFL